DGTICYHVLFDDGAEWINNGGATTLRTDANWTPQYPSSLTGSGGAGTNVWAAEVGVDVPFSQYAVDNDVDDVLEMVEHSVNTVNLIYLRDAGITHRLGRVVVRASSASDPYAGMTTTNALLGEIVNQWNSVLPASTHDLGLVATSATGGGVAYVGVVGNPGYSANGASHEGDFTIVWRHEVGHNWSLGHYDGGTPEGRTINSGNSLARMSGPEQARAIAHRNARLAHLDNLGPYPLPIPPHASLDRATYTPLSNAITIDVLANDHDANGEAFGITAFDGTSRFGGTVSLSPGTGPGGRDELRYTPPAQASPQTDHFRYRITDTAGREGLGTVVTRLVFDSDFLAHFAMDETVGAVAHDASSHGAHADLLGGPTWTAGTIGGGLDFDGVDDQLVAPAPDHPTSSFTVTGWIRRSGTQSTWAGVAFCRGGSTTTGLGFGGSNDLRYHWNGGQWSWSSGLVVPDNTWTFVALVVTPAAGTIYMDAGSGLQSATNPGPHAIEAFDAALTIGRDPNSSARSFRGSIDDLRFFARALTGAEILAASRGLGSASAPNPAHLAAITGSNANLTWVTSPATTNHRVWLSSSYTEVRDGLAAADWGLHPATSWTTPTLSAGTWYWRIDSTDGTSWAAGPVWSFALAAPANVVPYGSGCPGANAQVPAIGAVGEPRLGNSSFRFEVTGAAPQSTAALLLSHQFGFTPISGCVLLLGGTTTTFPYTLTDSTGHASQAVPIPFSPGLIGLRLFGQFLIADPGGALYGLGAMSNGLLARLTL
ncbi:MAG: hypothetical protein KDC98_14255, partial [Planctomycetes bacterium]|nr:hypothetical protein [Planctomycetota bacterium]